MKKIQWSELSERERQVLIQKVSLAAVLAVLLLVLLIKWIVPENKGRVVGVTDEVLQYRDMVEKACKKEKIPAFSNVVLAIMMQESAGQLNDVMQCSESGYNTEYEHYPNAITDPVYSVKIGVKTFKACLKKAGCKNVKDMNRLKLALQGYNYGEGYISWAKEHYKGYSPENAQEFSWMMASEMGWDSYGDPEYPDHVLQYFEARR